MSVILSVILEERIRQLAYRLYEQRGHQCGHEFEDWLRAEREVRGGASRSGKTAAERRSSDARPSLDRQGNRSRRSV